jgi:hypothetical protein
VLKSPSKATRKARQRVRAEHAARFAALSMQEAGESNTAKEYGWAEWMLEIISRREALRTKVEAVEMNLIELYRRISKISTYARLDECDTK